MSAAYIGAYEEVVQVYLDPGNSPGAAPLPDLLRDIDRLLERDNRAVTVIRRLDSGYDSADQPPAPRQSAGLLLLKGRDSLRGRFTPSSRSCVSFF